MGMYRLELTHDMRSGREVYIYHHQGKQYTLPKHLDKINSVLEDTATWKKVQAMELAIRLEKNKNNELVAQQESLERNYQIAINTILAINEGAPPSVVNKLIDQLEKRELILD